MKSGRSPSLKPAAASPVVGGQEPHNPVSSEAGAAPGSAPRHSARAEARAEKRSPATSSAMLADYATGAALDAPTKETALGANPAAGGTRPRKKPKKRPPCETKECENCGEMHPGTYGSGR